MNVNTTNIIVSEKWNLLKNELSVFSKIDLFESYGDLVLIVGREEIINVLKLLKSNHLEIHR